MVKRVLPLLCILLLLPFVFTDTIHRVLQPANRKGASSSTPVKFIYINRLTSWWGDKTIPAALAIPGFTPTPLPFTHVALTFWTYPGSAQDASGIWANIGSNMGPNSYGTTTAQIQATLKKNFTNAGVKFMVSAFGSTQTPTSAGVDPVDCGLKLAKFVKDNLFDGVDIDWEDTPAFQRGDSSGENWLITLTKTLRANLPADAIITHAPQGPYFSKGLYPKDAYLTVDKTVGDMIDFYNVQFYNQGVGIYDNAQSLFNVSGGWCPGSSINQMIAAGIPSSKIILGKPATTADASNGWMSAADLNQAIKDNYAYNGWNAGIMFWQFTSDIDGSFTNQVADGVLASKSSLPISKPVNPSQPIIPIQPSQPSKPITPSIPIQPSTPNKPVETKTIDRVVPSYDKKIGSSSTPIKFIYINRLTSWWGDKTVPAALGVPGFTPTPLPFTHVALTFWTYPGNAQDASGMWANIGSNMGPNAYGTTNAEIQATLKKNFTNAGVKFMVSAFGATQAPTSLGIDAVDCALKLAKFVTDNLFDGVDIDWQDTPAFNKGIGEDWLITLTKTLRANLPADAIITHAPQGPYFSKGLYPKDAYLTIEQQIGSMIDFYNVQFYNQGVGIYDSAQSLFNVSGGWCPGSSINEMIAAGIPSSKIILGKPATTADASNGWMSAADLNQAIKDNYAYNGWNAGIMFWQFTSDIDGSFTNQVAEGVLTSKTTNGPILAVQTNNPRRPSTGKPSKPIPRPKKRVIKH